MHKPCKVQILARVQLYNSRVCLSGEGVSLFVGIPPLQISAHIIPTNMKDDQGWIKLHRKVLENDIFRYDDIAWKVFMYLLLRADRKTGTVKSAYSTIAMYLDVSKSTIHRSISRLKKAKMVNDLRNDRYTLFTICKWSEYQGAEERLAERQRNDSGTIAEHIQEVRSKKIYTDTEEPKTTKPRKKKGERIVATPEDLQGIATAFDLTIREVSVSYQAMLDWEASKHGAGNHYVDERAGLRNWLRTNIRDGKVTPRRKL